MSRYKDLKYRENVPDEEWISKSELKRRSRELQDLGRQLIEITPAQLERLKLGPDAMAAITEAKRLKSRDALRRHFSYLGKLLRNEDVEKLEAALAVVHSNGADNHRFFAQLEAWRDRLLTDSDALGDFIAEYPDTDIQHLRQLVRNAQKEQAQDNPEEAANNTTTQRKKLFKYIREVAEAY